MIVSMWMTRDVVSIDPSMPVLQVADLMQARKLRRLPVLDAGRGKRILVGILSQTDILRALPPGMRSLASVSEDAKLMTMCAVDLMRTDPVTTTPETPIEEVAMTMRREKIGSLPVLRDGVLEGIITESDIFLAFARILATEVGEARVTFDMTNSEDVLVWLATAAQRRGVRVHSVILAEQHGRPVCVARVGGGRLDGFLDDLWKSGHKVLGVLRAE